MITLTHVDGTRLYQAERSAEPGFLTYYVSDPQVPTDALERFRTVDQLWSDNTLRGYFVFLTKEPGDIRLFAGAVAEHGFDVPGHASFAWAQYTENPTKLGTVDQLDLEPGSPPGAIVIATPTMFRFGTYGLPFVQNGMVQPVTGPDDGIQAFRIGYPFAYPPGGPPDLPPDLPPAEGTGVNVPLLGPQRYVMQSLALVGDFSSDSVEGFEVGLRYFYRQSGKVLSQFYPIFAPSSGSQVEFQVNWDPLAPLDRKRSWMKFTGNAYIVTITNEGVGKIEVAENANVLPTWLRTVYGKPLSLRPVLEGDHAARFVMQEKPAQNPDEKAYYMVPDGDYEVIAPSENSNEELNLLCGLAGTESIGFPTGTREAPLTTIRFHPDMPAFAPVFPLTDAKSSFESSGAMRSASLAATPLLDSTWMTAWPSVAPSGILLGTKATYYAQPEQAALYDAKVNAPANILELFQAPVAEFSTAALDNPYPMAIYAGLASTQVSQGFPPANVSKFELQILNSVRKGTIAGITARKRVVENPDSQVSSPLVTTTTPQGLVAKVQGLDWKSVLLAHSKEDNSKLEFIDLPPELREALQSNQLFLVVSLKEPLGKFDHNITLAGWPFNINVGGLGPGGEDDYRNVLIFKFGRGAIKDLVTDPKSWTSASIFNKNPAMMSVFLQNYIANAETSAQENHRFQKFVSIVSNPAWEGILALRVTVGLNQFPEDLKGLLAGIDLTRFAAHHFGIETSFVKANGTLQQDKSSLFGLISYIDRDYTTRQSIQAFHQQEQLITHLPPAVAAVDLQNEFYDFKVLQLEVVFENSELLDFTSKIQLTTTKWFGETATLQSGFPPDPINNQSIDLNGSYEVHNGQRSYSFYTDPSQTYKFLISSQVLNYVQIAKARFETLRSEPSGTSENIFTRFSFWGYLNFKALGGFDLFSFGSELNPQLSEKQGLYFSNFGITMDFTLLADQTTSNRTFAFDAGTASYDISQSQVRPNSLFNRFPMKVSSILQSDGGGPSALGYLSVRPPKEFEALKLTTEWYAVNCELSLGSMGALAEKAGFTAALLLAWSPSDTKPRAEVQIKLPGTGGGKKLLSLQGVLKLSIQYFEFTTQPLNEKNLQYQLWFRNAGLSLLGKKLPTAGTIDMVLGGDPERTLDAGSLSWMARYARDEKQALTSSTSRALTSSTNMPLRRSTKNAEGVG